MMGKKGEKKGKGGMDSADVICDPKPSGAEVDRKHCENRQHIAPWLLKNHEPDQWAISYFLSLI